MSGLLSFHSSYLRCGVVSGWSMGVTCSWVEKQNKSLLIRRAVAVLLPWWSKTSRSEIQWRRCAFTRLADISQTSLFVYLLTKRKEQVNWGPVVVEGRARRLVTCARSPLCGGPCSRRASRPTAARDADRGGVFTWKARRATVPISGVPTSSKRY